MAIIQQFGEEQCDVECIIRPGAYGVILSDEGLLAVIESRGQLLLPGGGIELGEEKEQALVREIEEEIGLQVTVGDYIGQANQYCVSKKSGRHYNKYCHYYLANKQTVLETKPEYELLWVSIKQAIERMGHESHCWALKQIKEGYKRHDNLSCRCRFW